MATRLLKLTVIASVGMVLSGCIDMTMLLSVRPDGSGTVTEVAYMNQGSKNMMAQMAAAMAAQMGAGGAGVQLPPPTVSAPGLKIDLEKCKAKAEMMGEGVELVYSKEITRADGTKGIKTLYSFEDIRTLKLSTEPDISAGQPGGMPGVGSGAVVPAKNDDGKLMTFGFEEGSSPKLTIHLPQRQDAPDAEAAPKAANIEMPVAQKKAMMKQMLGGFRFWTLVNVCGEITETNASYVNTLKKTGKKCLVTLIDMNLDKVMNDPEQFDKLAAMEQTQDLAAAKDQLKDLPALKVETAETVEITFTP